MQPVPKGDNYDDNNDNNDDYDDSDDDDDDEDGEDDESESGVRRPLPSPFKDVLERREGVVFCNVGEVWHDQVCAKGQWQEESHTLKEVHTVVIGLRSLVLTACHK